MLSDRWTNRRRMAMGLIEGIVITPVKKKKKDAPKPSTE